MLTTMSSSLTKIFTQIYPRNFLHIQSPKWWQSTEILHPTRRPTILDPIPQLAIRIQRKPNPRYWWSRTDFSFRVCIRYRYRWTASDKPSINDLSGAVADVPRYSFFSTCCSPLEKGNRLPGMEMPSLCWSHRYPEDFVKNLKFLWKIRLYKEVYIAKSRVAYRIIG